MVEALRAREGGRETASVIRMSLAALKNARIEKGSPLDPEEEHQVLAREMKQRQESTAEFEKAGRSETAARMKREIEILGRYLPPPMEDEDLAALALEAIRQVGARGPGQMGQVMGWLMPRVRGRAEGGRVRDMVMDLLKEAEGQ